MFNPTRATTRSDGADIAAPSSAGASAHFAAMTHARLGSTAQSHPEHTGARLSPNRFALISPQPIRPSPVIQADASTARAESSTDMVRDFFQATDALRATYTEYQVKHAALQQEKDALAQWGCQLDTERHRLQARIGDHQARSTALDQRHHALHQRASQVAQQHGALKQAMQGVDAQIAAAHAADARTAQQVTSLRAMLAELGQEQERLQVITRRAVEISQTASQLAAPPPAPPAP